MATVEEQLGCASIRLAILAACAFARTVEELLEDRSRKAVEVAERFADGPATALEIDAAIGAAQAAEREAREKARKSIGDYHHRWGACVMGGNPPDTYWDADNAFLLACESAATAATAALQIAAAAARPTARVARAKAAAAWEAARVAREAAQPIAEALRDIPALDDRTLIDIPSIDAAINAAAIARREAAVEAAAEEAAAAEMVSWAAERRVVVTTQPTPGAAAKAARAAKAAAAGAQFAIEQRAWLAEAAVGVWCSGEGQVEERVAAVVKVAAEAATVTHQSFLDCILAPRIHARFPVHVKGLATTIYEKRDWTLMPILADALEEMGLGAFAQHCREPIHSKGCHVLDSILGK